MMVVLFRFIFLLLENGSDSAYIIYIGTALQIRIRSFGVLGFGMGFLGGTWKRIDAQIWHWELTLDEHEHD
jgi:hypothetical protein